MFGINGAELLVLLFVFLIILGPKGIQDALRGFKRLVAWARSISAKLREESNLDLQSTGLTELNLSDFDLSQYDPREIIRQAVREEMDAWIEQAKQGASPTGNNPRSNPGSATIQVHREDNPSTGSAPAPTD
ncbi:translocase [Actinomyces sp. F1_1611]